MGAIGKRDGSRSPGDLLNHHRVGEIAHGGTAVLLFHGDTEQAQLAHFLPQFSREIVRLIDFSSHWRHTVLRPFVGHFAQCLDFLAEREIHACIEHGSSIQPAAAGYQAPCGTACCTMPDCGVIR